MTVLSMPLDMLLPLAAAAAAAAALVPAADLGGTFPEKEELSLWGLLRSMLLQVTLDPGLPQPPEAAIGHLPVRWLVTMSYSCYVPWHAVVSICFYFSLPIDVVV
jgi:hypothetical protein